MFKLKTVYYPAGSNGFIDIEDVLKAITLSIHTNYVGERYILIGENLCYYDIFKTIVSHAPIPKKLKPLPGCMQKVIRIGEFLFKEKFPISENLALLSEMHLLYNNSKSKELLGMQYKLLDFTLQSVSKRLYY